MTENEWILLKLISEFAVIMGFVILVSRGLGKLAQMAREAERDQKNRQRDLEQQHDKTQQLRDGAAKKVKERQMGGSADGFLSGLGGKSVLGASSMAADLAQGPTTMPWGSDAQNWQDHRSAQRQALDALAQKRAADELHAQMNTPEARAATERMRKLAREGRIEIAPQTRCLAHAKQVRRVMIALGYFLDPDPVEWADYRCIVTDQTTVGDMIDVHEHPLDTMSALSTILKVPVTTRSLICELAEQRDALAEFMQDKSEKEEE